MTMLQTKVQYTIITNNARQKETITQETSMYVVHPIHGLRPAVACDFLLFPKGLQSATFIVAIFSS